MLFFWVFLDSQTAHIPPYKLSQIVIEAILSGAFPADENAIYNVLSSE